MLYSFFNFGARWGRVVIDTPRPLYAREWPGTHCIGGQVGPRRSGRVRIISPPPGFDSLRSESLYRLSYLGPWEGKDGNTKRTARRITYPRPLKYHADQFGSHLTENTGRQLTGSHAAHNTWHCCCCCWRLDNINLERTEGVREDNRTAGDFLWFRKEIRQFL